MGNERGAEALVTRNRFAFWSVLLAATALAQACSDVGDSSAVPSGDAGALDDGGVSATDGASSGSDGALPADAGSNVGPVEDAPSGSNEAGSTPDAATSPVDAGEVDAASSEDGAFDAGAADSGADATTPFDAGTAADSGSTADAGSDGSSPIDAGTDASKSSPVDSGSDASAALVPCTVAGQTGCVQCQYNDGTGGSLPNADKVCTPTEALLVAHDIATGLAVAPGSAPESGCYACATEDQCLDDSEFGDTGHECGDLSGSANAAACQATIACILQTSCGTTDVTDCYCGSAPQSGSCASVGSSNAANGACKATEAAGLGFATNDGLDVLKNLSSTTLPSGVANLVFECAISNSCEACLH